MGKSNVVFEWQDLHENEDLPPDVAPNVAPRTFPQNLERRLLIGGVGLLFMAMLLSTYWFSRKAEANFVRLHNELILAVAAERRTSHEAAAPEREMRVFPAFQPDSEQVLTIEIQALGQDTVAVKVHTAANPADHASVTSYRQLHFYRRSEHGWQPIEPIPALWGQQQHLATAHFDISYRSRDAYAVRTVAAELDARYEQVRRNLGLPSTPKRRIDILVVVENVSRQSIFGRKHITVSSPARLRAPDSLTDAAILQQSILLHLVDNAMKETASTHRISPRWSPLLNAMSLWQIWDLEEPLVAGRAPVLRWLYSMNLPKMEGDAAARALAQYTEFCALDNTWRNFLIQQGLPFYCSTEEQFILVTLWSSLGNERASWPKRTIRLPSYQYYLNLSGLDTLMRDQERYESILTLALLDYAAATYGRAQIGALWPILHAHDDWQTLIPAVFSVSVEEFEAGWQAYLAEMLDN